MKFEVFKKFSPESRKVLIAAQKYSQLTNTVLSSDHLLMAIVVTSNSLAHKILKHIPLTVDQLRIVMGLQPPVFTEINQSLADELKQIIEQAAFIALKLESELIEVDHLMLGILSQKNSRAYWLIIQAGVEPDVIKKHLESHLAGSNSNEASATNPASAPINPPSNSSMPSIEIMGFMGDGQSLFGNSPDLSQLDRFGDIGFDEDSGEEPTALARLTIDLTALAKNKKLDPVVGRSKEIEQVINILGRKTKNNPVLVGDPGVGKTAIAEGLALKIAAGDVPYFLENAKVYSLELSSLVAGTMYRGQFEERLKELIEDIKQQKNAILFIDEVHTLVGAGGAEGSLDAANILKPALAKGSIRLIGATTPEEFRKHIKKDAALSRRLQVVKVEEPSAQETLVILKGLKEHYQKFHNVKMSDAFLQYAVGLADRFLSNRFFPDKAIDLIDEAAARARALQKTPKHILEIRDLKSQVAKLEAQKTEFIKKNLAKEAHAAREQIADTKEKIKKVKASAKKVNAPELSFEILEEIIASWTGIPVKKLSNSEQKYFASLERNLGKQVIGQKTALKKISDAIKMAKSGLNGNSSMGSFMLIGPTGVGKTFTAKVIAEEVFGSDKAITKLDMSEFSQPHQVARLIGAPAGYVGFGEANIFAERIRKNPHQVILFDEIEKAHPDIFNILLQIMDEGKLTDSNDEEIDFRHALILLTSNIGAEIWTGQVEPGFNKKLAKNQNAIMAKLKEYFKPEFLARLNDVIVFEPLDKKSLAKILDSELVKLEGLVVGRGLKIKVPQKVKDFLIEEIENFKTDNFKAGARGIKRILEQTLIQPIAHHILVNPKQTKIEFVLKDGKVSIKK